MRCVHHHHHVFIVLTRPWLLCQLFITLHSSVTGMTRPFPYCRPCLAVCPANTSQAACRLHMRPVGAASAAAGRLRKSHTSASSRWEAPQRLLSSLLLQFKTWLGLVRFGQAPNMIWACIIRGRCCSRHDTCRQHLGQLMMHDCLGCLVERRSTAGAAHC